MRERHLTPAVLAALADTPVVLLHGPRQCGKSTLVRWIAARRRPAAYYTLDDAAALAAATRDADAFLHTRAGPMVIDEVQFAPDLLRAVKLDVDRRRTPGRFLLTGSANVLMLPRLSESLAGRMEVLTLWPFSQGELTGVREGFIDRVFSRDAGRGLAPPAPAPRDLLRRIITGGYPEATLRRQTPRRDAWFGAYLTTVLQRDVRSLSEIEGLTEMPRLLTLLAAQCGGLLNVANLSRDIGLSAPTLKRYLTLLEATHLYQPLPAWSGNLRKRLIKTPKVYLNDTGLLAYLLGLGFDAAARGPQQGVLLEAFVCQELRKQSGWSKTHPTLSYFRTAEGREVDLVLEARGGRLVGVEVKAAMRVGPGDFAGLTELADATGDAFHAGVVLYQGPAAVAFGRRLWAIPITALFER